MFGRYRGFISRFKQNVPKVFGIGRVIHRQHLVTENLNNWLLVSPQLVINTVSGIHRNTLNTWLFAEV